MTHQAIDITHQSLSISALPGSWKLEAGRALTLQPTQAGVLRIAQGRMWVTMDLLRGDVQASGDLFLVPGRGLAVQAGQRIVLEPAGVDREAAAWFSWDPLPQSRAVQAAVRGVGRWQQAVLWPVRDLGLALGQAGAAVGRLLLGVAWLALGPMRPQSQRS